MAYEREKEPSSPHQQPGQHPSDPQHKEKDKDKEKEKGDKDKEDDQSSQSGGAGGGSPQQQLADLNKQVAEAQQKQQQILEHSPGVIPPLAPAPSMAELTGQGGSDASSQQGAGQQGSGQQQGSKQQDQQQQSGQGQQQRQGQQQSKEPGW